MQAATSARSSPRGSPPTATPDGPDRLPSLPSLPDVPTLTESGLPFNLVGWHAMFVPSGTPAEVVARLNQVTNQIMALPDVRSRLFDLALFPVQPQTTPEQWATIYRQDVQAWGDLVRSAGITPS